jgi:hypothetical protein
VTAAPATRRAPPSNPRPRRIPAPRPPPPVRRVAAPAPAAAGAGRWRPGSPPSAPAAVPVLRPEPADRVRPSSSGKLPRAMPAPSWKGCQGVGRPVASATDVALRHLTAAPVRRPTPAARPSGARHGRQLSERSDCDVVRWRTRAFGGCRSSGMKRAVRRSSAGALAPRWARGFAGGASKGLKRLADAGVPRSP